MGASEPPYLYDRPTNRRPISYPYSDFNPKAATQASYTSLADSQRRSQQPKQDGPLIDFNKHPDSYMIVASGQNDDHKPMAPNTKKIVVTIRWVQFGLRIVQALGAMGLLVSTICLTKTAGAATYLLRIPQAWDSIMSLYAIYHLLRPAKSRTPASSASYHFFALFMDTGLIPLYIFIALLTTNNYNLPVELEGDGDSANGRWQSFFNANATNLLMQVTFVAAIVMAGLHLVSIAIDLWLIIIFRKISTLPPDMNPLEDNLTRRTRSMKHMHKNSELTLSSTSGSVDEKGLKHLSGSTLSVAEQSRLSTASKTSLVPEDRNVPFRHSRTGSQTNLAFSPHNPESARISRHQFEGQQNLYQEAVTDPRRSRYEVRADGKLEVRTRRGSQSPSKRGSYIETMNVTTPTRSSFADPSAPFSSPGRRGESPRPGSYATARTSSPGGNNAAIPGAQVKQEQKEGLLTDNWYVLEDDQTTDVGSPADRVGSPVSRMGSPGPNTNFSRLTYEPLSADGFEPATTAAHPAIAPRPLGMHPPTPPMFQQADNKASSVDRTLTIASNVTATSSIYSESAPSLKSSKGENSPRRHQQNSSYDYNVAAMPKGRYYGSLAAAQHGVRGSPTQQPLMGGYGLPPSPQASRTPSPEKKGRVISRSGADIADESVMYIPEKSAMRNRRDVSGKIAEEGRGGAREGGWGRGYR